MIWQLISALREHKASKVAPGNGCNSMQLYSGIVELPPNFLIRYKHGRHWHNIFLHRSLDSPSSWGVPWLLLFIAAVTTSHLSEQFVHPVVGLLANRLSGVAHVGCIPLEYAVIAGEDLCPEGRGMSLACQGLP